MKVILYFIVYSSILLSLFCSFLYLMTVVDPGLMDLPEKAALMLKRYESHYQPPDESVMIEDQYVDLGEVLLNKSKAVQNNP